MPGTVVFGSRRALDTPEDICIIQSMDLIEALDLIESAEHAEEAYHEMLADLGSSFFMGGAQGNGGYDALTLARAELDRTRDRDAEAEFDLAVAEARRVVAYYEAIAPGEPRICPRLNPADPRALRVSYADPYDAEHEAADDPTEDRDPDGWHAERAADAYERWLDR